MQKLQFTKFLIKFVSEVSIATIGLLIWTFWMGNNFVGFWQEVEGALVFVFYTSLLTGYLPCSIAFLLVLAVLKTRSESRITLLSLAQLVFILCFLVLFPTSELTTPIAVSVAILNVCVVVWQSRRS